MRPPIFVFQLEEPYPDETQAARVYPSQALA